MGPLVGLIFVGAAYAFLGWCQFRWPRTAWYISRGWWSYANPQDVRLSEAYLACSRIAGVVAMMTGVCIMLVGILNFADKFGRP